MYAIAFAASQQNLLAVIILPKQNQFERLLNANKKYESLKAANVTAGLRKSINTDDSIIGWTAGNIMWIIRLINIIRSNIIPSVLIAAAAKKANSNPLEANSLHLQ